MKIGLIVQDGFFASTVSAILDIVSTAEFIRPQIDPSIAPLDITAVGTKKTAQSPTGMTLSTRGSFSELSVFDTVIVPALGTLTEDLTRQSLASKPVQQMIRALQHLDPSKQKVAAACTGVFALASSGLVDERRVTTTWFQVPLFRALFPQVDVDLETMVVMDGNFVTAGAAFAHIDLALSLVRGISPTLATEVARLLLIDRRPSQSTFIAYDHLRHDDPLLQSFERFVRAHLAEPLDVNDISRELGASRRTLERRAKHVLGLSPLEIVQRLRLERAAHLRQTTSLSTDQIADQVGYANGETLRALERRWRRGG